MHGRVGRPRRRPKRLAADRGYDFPVCRRQLRERGITPEIARRKTEHGSGLGRVRWVVERTFAWQAQARRLSKDDELLCTTSEALIYVCMIRLLLRRLTRR